MAKTKVEIEVSTNTEIALMSRYGRKRELKTLVLDAIAEALSLKTPWQKPVREPRQKAEPPQDQPDGGSLGSPELDKAYDRIVDSQSESGTRDA